MSGSDLLADVRHAARLHARHPAFAAAAVVVLAAAIGATAMFSLVRAVILRDLPFADPDRLVWVYNARVERDRAPFSIPDLDDYRRESPAAVGVYAIAAFSAAARVRELAIRSAFGASERDLISLIVATEYPAVCLGIAGGLTLALLVSRSLGAALFSVAPWDPGTYLSVALILLAVTFIAAWMPAMRAGRVDPAQLLRS